MTDAVARDWTAGAAKWGAVLVLGTASLTGIVWSIARSIPAPSRIAAGTPAEQSQSPAQNEAPPSATPSRSAPPAALTPAKIDLNKATSAELEVLPGVGPALAGRIVEYRRAHGAFRTVEQLDGVKGIGPKLMEKIRPLVKITPPDEQPR